jgi:protein farnesyltransferase/geranylgeranyltransferase type-1 subunit alpha
MSDYSDYSDSMGKNPKKLSEDPDYADLQPVPVPQHIPNFFSVSYSDYYKELVGYFYALFDKKELSERALRLCNRFIDLYPTNNSPWTYKMEILDSLGFDIEKESKWIDVRFKEAPKTFQIWNYFKWFNQKNPDKIDPLKTLEMIFGMDHKNYMAWSFIVWYVKLFGKAEEMYQLTLAQIDKDIMNNSAWSTRMFLAEFLGMPLEEEFKQAKERMFEIPKNQSISNFLFGICEKKPELINELNEIGLKLQEEDPTNYIAYRILLFKASVDKNQQEIESLCDKLIQYDPIRVNYYQLIKEGKVKYE